nr:membrane protein insertion efficiency factor YidD [Cellulomonas endophytica]
MPRVLVVLRGLPVTLLVLLVRGYQTFVSPLTPPTCRYYPSCSQYAVIALRRHGLVRGGWLAVRRVGRCHPWAPGGVDDVPPARTGTVGPRGSSYPQRTGRPTGTTVPGGAAPSAGPSLPPASAA